MAARRTVLGVVFLLAATAVRADCPGPAPALRLPDACVGETTSGSASFCFAPGCLGTGVVAGLEPPGAPFTVTGVHVDGILGSQPVVFPVQLLPGDAIFADVAVVVPGPGSVADRLAWIIGREGDGGGEACEVDVAAAAPLCQGGGQCAAETCVAGACVGGTPVDCDDGNSCTVDTCDPAAGCVHTPSNAGCVATTPCSTGICDPVQGCIQVPVSGTPCDDGDACTTGDHCDAGVCRGAPVTCPSDGAACSVESCVHGACRSTPVDSRCGSDECSVGACRPDDPGADGRGCVTVPVGEGQACTDDGVACTDDVCTGGVCLHVPLDDRCSESGSCTAAVCSPERADRDARGCAVGPPPAPVPTDGAAPTGPGDGGDGQDGGDGGGHGGKGKKKQGNDGGGPDAIPAVATCGEDGDPCTEDVCVGGLCTHTPVADAAACAPVRGVFRKTLGLAGMTRNVMAAMGDGPSAARTGDAGVAVGLLRLDRVADDLDAAGRALAGQDAAAPGAGLVRAALAFPPSVAQQRARVAFTHVLRTPREVQSFLAILAEARARAALGADTARTLRQRGRLLLRGTKTLKGDLRRLQRVSQTFAR